MSTRYFHDDQPVALYTRPDWHADANCRGMNPELFFPERGETTAEAKATCRRCDVQVECLLDSLNRGEKHGIWGGKSERERRMIRSAQRNRSVA
jgi:WhiB family transcriptional regulator, redox-sensing transcriptional regulator